MPASARRDEQAGVLGVVADQEVAVAGISVPADLALCEGPARYGDGRMNSFEEVAEIALAFFWDGLIGVIDCGPGQRCCDGLVGVVGLGVRDCDWVDVAVAVAGDFEEFVRRRDHEEAVREVEDCGLVCQALLLGVGDGHVADYLAGGFADATQVDEGGCPCASGQDGEVSCEFGVVVEADARDGVGLVVDEKLLDAVDDELDAVQFLNLLAQPDHGALSVGPARAPVDVTCAAIAPCIVALQTRGSANLFRRLENFDLIGSDPADILKRRLYVLLLFAPCCQGEAGLVVFLRRKVGSPSVLSDVSKAVVWLRSVVGADDA